MPIPTPKSGENEQEFIARCIKVMYGESGDEAQAAAICYTAWDNREFKKTKSGKYKTLEINPFSGAKTKLYDWDVCIADMKEQGYSDDVAAKICGSIKAGG